MKQKLKQRFRNKNALHSLILQQSRQRLYNVCSLRCSKLDLISFAFRH